jgi:phospholipid-binding lipoprotein MlaA
MLTAMQANPEAAAAPEVPTVPQAPLPAPVAPVPASPVKAPVAEDIVVTAQPTPKEDPLKQANEVSFEVVEAADKAIVGPAAMAYKETLPNPIRKGLHNFLYNIGEPVVAVNFLLQLKPGKAIETVGRFAINSTVGVAGLFDVAKKKPFHLPHRVNGFAYTMGYYGIKPGAYLFLPLIGPTTVRDVTGRLMDLAFLPTIVGAPLNDPFYTLPSGVIYALDDRVLFDAKLQELRNGDRPAYAAQRDYYLTKRQAEIDELRGKKPAEPAPAAPVTSPQN